MSKVSIYMSSYNHANFLHEAIDSVLNQTFLDYELFILDDASTDESWSIIQSYTDPRIHSFRNTTNRNDREWMRKVIFEIATGEYIAIQHSDYVWEPEKLKKQMDFMDVNPDIGAVFTNAQHIDQNGNPFKDPPNHDLNRSRYEWLNYFFYHGSTLYHPSVLIRKKCYEECGFYRNGFVQMPDFEMWVRLCMKYEIHVIPEKLVRYRLRSDENGISGNRPEVRIRNQFEFLQVLDNYRMIPTYQEFVKIFPTSKKYFQTNGYDIGFLLGMTAIEIQDDMSIHTSFYRFVFYLFGLKQLFEAISDPNRANRILELYGFTHKDFKVLTGKYDVFSIEEKANPNKKWKIDVFISRVRNVLAPRNSFRYRILKSIYEVIVSPIKIRQNRKNKQ